MRDFIHKFKDKITGVLSGFDRFIIRGTLLPLVSKGGMYNFLSRNNVLLKNFKRFVQQSTEQLKAASVRQAEKTGRPIEYLSSSRTKKEDFARAIEERDGVEGGLICIMKALENSLSFDVVGNRETHLLELIRRPRKCLHFYHYFRHPIFGFMSGRIETWFPFGIQIWINGREWLANRMEKGRVMGYERYENCFTWLEDVQRAQRLMDGFIQLPWIRELERIARMLNPAHDAIFKNQPMGYYWSIHQSEWATDIMFAKPSDLAAIYPALVRHAMTNLSTWTILRYLGKKNPRGFQGEVTTKLKERPEGVCIRHSVDKNSQKMYDKGGSVLRIENTLNNPGAFKVFRAATPTGKASGERSKPAWRPLRKGFADIRRRIEVSGKCNERYLDALALADTDTPVWEVVKTICRPAQINGRRIRAMRPWSVDDRDLLKAVGRGEYTVNGFRNRHLQAHLYKSEPRSQKEQKRRSAQVSRKLRMLRAHGLIHRINKTNRYQLTKRGREMVSAVLTTQQLTLKQIALAAA